MNNHVQLISQFPAFMMQMRGKDPNQLLQSMIASGQITQSQLDQAQQMAGQLMAQMNQFKSMFGFK